MRILGLGILEKVWRGEGCGFIGDISFSTGESAGELLVVLWC
jgi:hypothetical protein